MTAVVVLTAASWLASFVASFLLAQEASPRTPLRLRYLIGALGGLAFAALAGIMLRQFVMPWYCALASHALLALVTTMVMAEHAPEDPGSAGQPSAVR